MGVNPMAAGIGEESNFTGVDSLVLYTLSPGGTSEFSNIKLCIKNCTG